MEEKINNNIEVTSLNREEIKLNKIKGNNWWYRFRLCKKTSYSWLSPSFRRSIPRF